MSKYFLIGIVLGVVLVSLFFWFPTKEPTPYIPQVSIEDMQKIVDANEKLVKEMKDGSK